MHIKFSKKCIKKFLFLFFIASIDFPNDSPAKLHFVYNIGFNNNGGLSSGNRLVLIYNIKNFILLQSTLLGSITMGDYHFVYKDVEGASTQWDDIQRKLGNLPEKPPAFKPPSFTPAQDEDSVPKDKAWIDEKSEQELEELEEDLDDDRFLEEYRLNNKLLIQKLYHIQFIFMISVVSY